MDQNALEIIKELVGSNHEESVLKLCSGAVSKSPGLVLICEKDLYSLILLARIGAGESGSSSSFTELFARIRAANPQFERMYRRLEV